jgi:hypothetical protein
VARKRDQSLIKNPRINNPNFTRLRSQRKRAVRRAEEVVEPILPILIQHDQFFCARPTQRDDLAQLPLNEPRYSVRKEKKKEGVLTLMLDNRAPAEE